MKTFCLTVDLDRDSNISIPGQVSAGSLDMGQGAAPRFSSSGKGLKVLSGLLDEIGIKATFFAEGRTIRNIGTSEHLVGHEIGIHGFDHEDMTLLSMEDKKDVLKRSIGMVEDITGRVPVCSRAPYMKADAELLEMLPDLGIRYDSSFYADIEGQMAPFKIGDIYEVPVPEGRDGDGRKMSAYLWPMHESKRVPSDYIDMASTIDEGIFNIATHTWHMVESRIDGPMSFERIETNTENVRNVIVSLLDMGFHPMTIPEAVRRFLD